MVKRTVAAMAWLLHDDIHSDDNKSVGVTHEHKRTLSMASHLPYIGLFCSIFLLEAHVQTIQFDDDTQITGNLNIIYHKSKFNSISF